MKITQVVYLQRIPGACADYFEPYCGLEFENGDMLRLDVGKIVAKEQIGETLNKYLPYYIIHRFDIWEDMDCSFCNYETLLNYKQDWLENYDKNESTTEDDEAKDMMDCLKLMADVVTSKGKIQTADDAITVLDKLKRACELVKKHENKQED